MISWCGETISVRAHLVPKYLWTTASIDVYLGRRCILQTGGKPRVAGLCRAEFEHQGSAHLAELFWDRARVSIFPFSLIIDDARILDSFVEIENRKWSIIPALAITAAAALSVLFVYFRFSWH